MNNLPIPINIFATLDSGGVWLDSDDWMLDAAGGVLELPSGSSQPVCLRLQAEGLSSACAITGVRSSTTPDFGQGPWTSWHMIDGVYVSPLLNLGDEIRVEVLDANGEPTVPEGGGHFRIVEEGGGFVLSTDRDASVHDSWPRGSQP